MLTPMLYSIQDKVSARAKAGFGSVLMAVLAAVCSGCKSSSGQAGDAEPLRALDRHVDLGRFMGDWYVIAHTPKTGSGRTLDTVVTRFAFLTRF